MRALRTRTRTRRSLLSLVRDERGSAFAETVIMLPFFILIFAAIQVGHRSYRNAIDNATKTRSMAWLHSMTGCRAAVGGGIRANDVSVAPFGPVGEALQKIDGVLRVAAFFAGPYPGFWPNNYRYDGSMTAARTGVSSTPAQLRWSMMVPCNEFPQKTFTLQDWVARLAQQASPTFGGQAANNPVIQSTGGIFGP